jgi:hypothetical protein
MRLRDELVAGLVVLAATASTCQADDGLALPKDLVLPANVRSGHILAETSVGISRRFPFHERFSDNRLRAAGKHI